MAATEALERLVLSLVPVWPGRLVMLQVALKSPCCVPFGPSDYTPVEEVNALWALEGDSFIHAHGGDLLTCHDFSWRKFEGVFFFFGSSKNYNMLALEGLFRKIGTATVRDRDSITH